MKMTMYAWNTCILPPYNWNKNKLNISKMILLETLEVVVSVQQKKLCNKPNFIQED